MIRVRLLRFAGVMVMLGIVDGLLDGLVKPLHERRAWSRGTLADSHGAGALWGWLGGFRALAADLLWLNMHARWEVRDLAAAEALIGFASGVDPRPLYFWLNGARIVAYDFPAWRIEAEGGYKKVSLERQHAIDAEQAKRALVRIAEARKAHPHRAELWVEQANIELNRLRDAGAAAESYRQAALQPGAPFYAARLHAELLRRLGKTADAYTWLRELHPGLPRGEAAAGWEWGCPELTDTGVGTKRKTQMKTQIRKPSAEKSHYSAEYKQESIDHWKSSGRSAAKVAAELGIRAPLLYRWAKKLRPDAQQGVRPQLTVERRAELEARIRELTTENAKLLEQREVLKKSLGILSEAPRSGMPKSSK